MAPAEENRSLGALFTDFTREVSALIRKEISEAISALRRQLAMLEGDRFEILDINVRPDSELVGKPFRDLPMTGALIGAIVRDGSAIFPHGDDVLLPDDRVIVFTESSRVPVVERAL